MFRRRHSHAAPGTFRKENDVRIYPCTRVAIFSLAMAVLSLTVPCPAVAADAMGIEKNAQASLEKLYTSQPAAKTVAEKAKAILVFPNVFKAGFLGGAHYGEGVLFQNDQVMGYYSSVAGSFGLQAGVQVFGYAMFLMSDQALEYLDRSGGWELGSGPSVVVVGMGMGKSLTTTTIRDDVYAFIFNQQGLMAGFGIQGSKITKIQSAK
jgi:lipid-binding SYLF domain-containing protein